MEGPETPGLPGSSGSPSSVMTGMVEASGDDSTIPISRDSAEAQSGGARTLLTVLQGWNNRQDRYRNKYSAGPDTPCIENVRSSSCMGARKELAITFVQMGS